MKDVGFSESDRQVAIGVGGLVELQLEGSAIEFECAVCGEDLARNRAGR